MSKLRVRSFRLVRIARATEPPCGRPASYWIGLVGGPVGPEVRHHVDLPEGQGLMVMEVVPDSPAAEAGLQQYDIMLRAGDVELTHMRDLIELVRTEGERQGQIAMEIARHGQRETVWLAPAERPANMTFRRSLPGQHPEDRPGGGLLGGLLEQFGQGPDGAFQFRHFGPGSRAW